MPLLAIAANAGSPAYERPGDTSGRRAARVVGPCALQLWSNETLRYFASTYLDASSRRSLCWANKRIYACLRQITYVESVDRHIPLTRTISSLNQLLFEVGRCDTSSQVDKRIAIARQLAEFPRQMRRKAMDALLSSTSDPDEKARLLAVLAPAMRFSIETDSAEDCLDSATWSKLQRWAWRQAEALKGEPGRNARAALMSHGVSPTSGADLAALLAAAQASGSDGTKAAALSGVIVAFRQRFRDCNTSASVVGLWQSIYDECLSLPAEYRPKLLSALAVGIPAASPEDALLQWPKLIAMAEPMADGDKLGIYSGMVTLLDRLPRATVPPLFDDLWQRCSALPFDRQRDLLERMARASVYGNNLQDYAVDRIMEASLERLPPDQRIVPIRMLMKGYPGFPYGTLAPRILNIPHDRLSPDEWAILIGDCGSSEWYRGPLPPLLEKTLSLPPSVRHLALAGIVHNACLVMNAGGSEWIDRSILPLIDELSASHRAEVLFSLARLALNADCPPHEGPRDCTFVSPPVWTKIQHHIGALPPMERADLVNRLCRAAGNVAHPVWPWALEQCQTLPRYLQAPILEALASARQLPYNSDPGPLQKLLPNISALPRLYRAFPAHAAARMRKHLDFTDSMRTLFPMLKLQWSLPAEDSI